MDSFGLGRQGFKRKRYNDLIESMNNRAKGLFGEDVNLSPRSPLGIFFRVIAWSLALLWETTEKVYYSGYVDTAEGIQLDYLGKYIGIERRLWTSAKGEILILGDSGTLVQKDFIVETKDEIKFKTTESGVINEAGELQLTIEAIMPGVEGNVPANTITEITNPMAGVDSVTNPAALSEGTNIETDAEFRERYIKSVAKGGASTLASIRASLLELTGVRAALVLENSSNGEDAEGRPPKSIECYVLGGSPKDIGEAILSTKAAGIETVGAQSVSIEDIAGNPHTVKFTFAEMVPIYCNVSITKNPQYPLDGDERVRTELIKHIGGTDTDGNIYSGLGMGQELVFTKLINSAFGVPGISDIALQVSTDGIEYITGNIAVAMAKVAETDHTKVVVTSA